MDHSIIFDVAICIIVAWILAVVAQLLRQPLILAYLIAGFVVGPLAQVKRGSIEPITELGLILLLFMIGVEIDLKKVLSSGRQIMVTAATQILGGCLLGVLFFKWLGYSLIGNQMEALYLGVAAALSSTVITVKVLYDKRELDTLPGRVTLGVLVMQDLFAILFLAVQPNLNEPATGIVLSSLSRVVLLVAVAFTASRYALPPLFRAVARLPELVQVGALAWCFLIAELGSELGLSREMGALVAGVAISTFPYTLDIAAKVTTLRDFFVTLYFVALGMTIPTPTPALIGASLVFAGFLVLSRFVTVFPLLYVMKQGHRASLLPAIHLSQASEFALVILALGLKQFHHIGENVFNIVAYAFVFLGVASTYAILRSDALLQRAGSLLTRLGLRDLDRQTAFMAKAKTPPRIFLLGFSWTASSLLEEITRNAPDLLDQLAILDFNPLVNEELRRRQVNVIYGDIAQRDTLLHAGVDHAEIIVCTLPNTVLKGSTNLRLLQHVREINPTARIISHAELFEEVPKLYAAGANYVSLPRITEAVDLCEVIQAARKNLLDEKRAEQDHELANRKEVIP